MVAWQKTMAAADPAVVQPFCMASGEQIA